MGVGGCSVRVCGVSGVDGQCQSRDGTASHMQAGWHCIAHASGPAQAAPAHHRRHRGGLQHPAHLQAELDVRRIKPTLLPGPLACGQLSGRAHGAPAGRPGRKVSARALLQPGAVPPPSFAHLCSQLQASTPTRCPASSRTWLGRQYGFRTPCSPSIPMAGGTTGGGKREAERRRRVAALVSGDWLRMLGFQSAELQAQWNASGSSCAVECKSRLKQQDTNSRAGLHHGAMDQYPHACNVSQQPGD